MDNLTSKYGFIIIVLIISVLPHPREVFCKPVNDLEMLSLYYKDQDLVVSPTRNPKRVSYVAENITVITSQDIDNMNAHTLADVLKNVPGLFINYSQDFGAPSIISIQGSEERHVVVIIDGIRWNFLSSNAAETNSIPIGIIDRIEIIKGPASSSWGSSLGGVINIITKKTGENSNPKGSVKASYGEENTYDVWGNVYGKAGPVGYYLYAGQQDSDGLKKGRFYESNKFYSKYDIPVFLDGNLSITCGYSETKSKLGDFPEGDISATTDSQDFFTTAALNIPFTKDIDLELSMSHLERDFIEENSALGMGVIGEEGDRFLDTSYDDRITSGTGKLSWNTGNHTIVIGTDLYFGSLDQTLLAGDLLQLYGVEEEDETSQDVQNIAFFLNDTIILNKWSFTPGIRLDENSVSGSFWSPSLGSTYQVDEKTLLRCSISRGFSYPPLAHTKGGGLFLDPNSELKPEKIWSFQTGLETNAIKFLWIKNSFFYHDLEDAQERELYGGGPPAFNDIYNNEGKIIRKGIELEFETVSFYNLKLWAGGTYILIDNVSESELSKNYSIDVALRYEDAQSLKVSLSGHYIYLDYEEYDESNFNQAIWDLNLNKTLYNNDKLNLNIFFTLHNIFNGDQYFRSDNPNPGRWIEGGIRVNI